MVRGEIWSFATELLLAEIITKPISAAVAAGETASFSVQVQSATPETYQWFKVVDGVDQAVQKPTANAATLVLDNVGLADEGLYRCRIRNNAGDIFTDAVFLVVKRKMGHWTFDGSLADQVNPAHRVHPWFRDMSKAFPARHGDLSGIRMSLSWKTALAISTSTHRGIRPAHGSRQPRRGWGAYVAKQLKGTGIASKGFILTHDGGNAVTTLRQSFNDLGSADVTVNDGQWHHIVGTYDAIRGLGRIYVDGKLNNTSGVNMTALTGTDQPVNFGGETVAGDVAFVGSLDDVQIWNYALDGYEVATVFTDIRTDQTICVEIDPMDFDGNCRVDLADFALFAAKWLDCNRIPAGDCTE